MSKIIMALNDQEYESTHDFDSLDDFYAACDSGALDDEFEGADYSAGGQCTYRLAD
jgi:hypothetical protein